MYHSLADEQHMTYQTEYLALTGIMLSRTFHPG